MSASRAVAGARRVRVWDLPTRLFHWGLVACISGLMVTGYIGGAAMPWHARLGYAVLALLLFRLVWGFVGGRWSRFITFFYAPRRVLAYLRGHETPDRPGHNPLGALSVFAMLAVLLAQVGSGLVSDDEIAFSGPLSRLVAADQALWATWFHKDVGQWVIVALVLTHIAAVMWYLLRKKTNLVKPMLDGDKSLPLASPAVASRDDARSRLLAAVVFAGCSLAVGWVQSLG
ncbi:MAG TPA: cytochrome b/b6 domain-containing protein [Ramlibacter sp.]|nr:cytochrome b/b6 domain-containing protein [Ramlibacter sp.]